MFPFELSDEFLEDEECCEEDDRTPVLGKLVLAPHEYVFGWYSEKTARFIKEDGDPLTYYQNEEGQYVAVTGISYCWTENHSTSISDAKYVGMLKKDTRTYSPPNKYNKMRLR
jgi:hypothetical protein